MALRTILEYPDVSLRKISRAVTKFDKRLHILLDDMAETLRDIGGAGLAAVQVGVLRRVCVVEVEENNLIEFINPEVIETDGEQSGPEGCLSIPGKSGLVTRPLKVRVRAFDRHGNPFEAEGEDLKARAICHELDHLDGKLYTDLAVKMADSVEELMTIDN